jgi:hypothetical protein
MDPEFPANMFAVIADRENAQVQNIGDLLTGLTLPDQLEHFPLARRQGFFDPHAGSVDFGEVISAAVSSKVPIARNCNKSNLDREMP